MKEFFKRLLTGLFLVVLLIGGIFYNSILFAILFVVIIAMGMFEFYRLSRKERIKPQKYMGILVGISLFGSSLLHASGILNIKIFLLFIPLIMLIFVDELYRNNRKPFSNIAYTILGILYIALPFSLFNYFVFGPFAEITDGVSNLSNLPLLNSQYKINYNPNLLLGFFFLQWACDTGAYLVGVAIGKNRLFERISPKKSWEGSIGGMVITLGIAYVISMFFKEISMENWMIVGLIIVVMGTFGDLAESLYKRSLGVKDSGEILPGHGGILDRFDSVLFSAPIVFTYLQII